MKSLRFKTVRKSIWVQTGPSQGDGYEDYYDVQVPIRDWKINPENIDTSYTNGGKEPNIPITIEFPELSEYKPKQYQNVYFEIEVMYQGTQSDWLNFTGKDLSIREFTKVNPVDTTIELSFNGLSFLPQGRHIATMVIKAYEKTNGKSFIETSPAVNVILNIKESKTPDNNPDFRTRNITYDKSTKKVTGDLPITINDINSFDTATIDYFDVSISKTTSQSTINLSPKILELDLSPATIYKTSLKLWKNNNAAQNQMYRSIPILLDITNNNKTPTDFSISPTDFEFVLSKSNNEFREGVIQLYNPHNLVIQLEVFPTFIENVRIVNGEVRFQTKSSEHLNLGNYSGEIILTHGKVKRKANISLKVIQTIENTFNGQAYYFALDKHKLSIIKTNPLATYVTMKLDLYYKGYDNEFQESQTYSEYYFEDKIDFYPGDEVQDFFIKCKQLSTLDNFNYQYDMAVVKVTVKEFDSDDRELSESRLNDILFVPGKKPKHFPIFTDFGKRRTYPNSKILLNTDVISEKSAINKLFEKSTQQKPNITREFKVYSYLFERNLFQLNENKKILTAGNIEFIPFPAPRDGKIIHLFFENQNLVLDWFSCPYQHQRKFDFNHITDTNTGEKFGSLETENLILNTGWILREEIELINALIKSRICFIMIDDKIIKATPITKKNEIYDSMENLYAMDLEFNIKTNER